MRHHTYRLRIAGTGRILRPVFATIAAATRHAEEKIVPRTSRPVDVITPGKRAVRRLQRA